MNVTGAIKHPFNDSDWVKKFLYSYLYLVPFVGGILLSGYQVRIVRENNTSDKDRLPEWDDWGTLLKDGLYIFFIGLFYIIIPIVLLLTSILPAVAGLLIAENASSGVEFLKPLEGIAGIFGPVVSLILMSVSILWLLIGVFLFPMAVGIYSIAGSVSGALNIFKVIVKIFSHLKDYLIVTFVPMGAGFVWGSVNSAVASIPGLGFLYVLLVLPVITCPVNFYIYVLSAKLIGDMFRENPDIII